jgi:AmiR/NasT family two-component response regulator
LDHRVLIERAVGVLMGEHRIDAVSAFNRLRHDARSARRRAVDVARDVLAEFG